jgi:hypothetical protein
VTLPEKIEEVLRLEAAATPGEWECYGIGHVRSLKTIDGEEHSPCDCKHISNWPDSDAAFIAAARNIIRPLAQAYTAALTALEASDSDRQKLKARVAELEALCQTIGKQSTEYATKVGYAEGRAMGLEYRVRELAAELAKSKTDRDWFQSMLARNASTQA